MQIWYTSEEGSAAHIIIRHKLKTVYIHCLATIVMIKLINVWGIAYGTNLFWCGHPSLV